MDKTRYITINLTNRCNLKCIYCYEHDKNNDVIPFDTAKSIIDVELSNIKKTNYERLSIELFGGEPFLEFELIVKITDYIRTVDKGNIISILVTTNGTLVHNSIQRWLKENSDLVKCCLSLDGNKAMHNRNRCGSFDSIDLDFFATVYPDCQVKMTITPETVPQLAEGVIFCHEKGFRVGGNFAYGMKWKSENKAALQTQLEILSNYYYDHPEVEPCELLSRPIKINDNSGFCHKSCGVGVHTHSYDTHGDKYPCQFFLPISIGFEKAQRMKSFVFDEMIPNDKINEPCRDCIYEPSCFNCYGSNYQQTGDVFHRDMGMCEITKTVIDARCDFIANLWHNGRSIMDKESELETLRSIIAIYDYKSQMSNSK